MVGDHDTEIFSLAAGLSDHVPSIVWRVIPEPGEWFVTLVKGGDFTAWKGGAANPWSHSYIV